MRIVVAGANGGIGQALLLAIINRFPESTVFATWHSTAPTIERAAIRWSRVDLTDEEQVLGFGDQVGRVDWVINAAGVLHNDAHGPEKTIRHLDPEFFMHTVKVNALPTLLLAKAFNGRFNTGGTGVMATISARVGSIEDNRLGGWTSYRCSKAALNMAVKNLSIEWARTMKNVIVFALHPGTTDTALSEPFQAAVPAGKLFTAEQTAGFLLNVIQQLTPEHSGSFLAYDKSEIPW